MAYWKITYLKMENNIKLEKFLLFLKACQLDHVHKCATCVSQRTKNYGNSSERIIKLGKLFQTGISELQSDSPLSR